MSSSFPAAIASTVRCRSSADGSGSVDGWLWTRIRFAAWIRTASRNSSATRTSAAETFYLSNGRQPVPIVFRGRNGLVAGMTGQDARCVASYLAQIPGLKVVQPATPLAAKALLAAAIRDPGPVAVLEDDRLYSHTANSLGGVPEDAGVPDGLCVDAEGCVWSAHWGGWRITRYAPDGRIERVLQMPVPQPSSCTFGGPGLATLYVTSAAISMSAADLAKAPDGGGLFALEVGVRGLPASRFAA